MARPSVWRWEFQQVEKEYILNRYIVKLKKVKPLRRQIGLAIQRFNGLTGSRNSRYKSA
jgi:hypothetical protein